MPWRCIQNIRRSIWSADHKLGSTKRQSSTYGFRSFSYLGTRLRNNHVKDSHFLCENWLRRFQRIYNTMRWSRPGWGCVSIIQSQLLFTCIQRMFLFSVTTDVFYIYGKLRSHSANHLRTTMAKLNKKYFVGLYRYRATVVWILHSVLFQDITLYHLFGFIDSTESH